MKLAVQVVRPKDLKVEVEVEVEEIVKGYLNIIRKDG